jgi:ribosome-associated protein
VVNALEDVKAQNIKVYNTVGLSDMFDRVVLASGTSNRQTRALAHRVAQEVKQAGGHVVSIEGADAGEWVLVDLGDLVVHVMQPAIREYYGLEEIWGGKPVKLKLVEPAAKRIAAHAAHDSEAAAERKPTRAAAARKSAPARKRAPTAGSAAPKKAAAKKAPRRAPARAATRRKSGAA